MDSLRQKFIELLSYSVQTRNTKQDSYVNLHSLKLWLVAKMLNEYGMDFKYLFDLFETHTPVDYDIAKTLRKDTDFTLELSQDFVPNKKLIQIVETLKDFDDLDFYLAVDGLAGNIKNGPNFDRKLYIGNLKFNEEGNTTIFDVDPEYRKRHVQLVRKMYRKLGKNVPSPHKQIYEILRICLEEMAKCKLPRITFEENENVNGKLLGECVSMYNSAIGKENAEKLAKSLQYE